MAEKQERTEEPTPRKLEEARREGQVARSSEVPIGLGLLAAVIALRMSAEGMVINLQRSMQFFFLSTGQWIHEDLTIPRVMNFMGSGIRFLLAVLAPLFIALVVMALISNMIQTGPMLSLKSLEPKLNRISLAKGLGSLFSQRSIMEAAKSSAKVTILGVLAYNMLAKDLPMILELPLTGGPGPVLKVMGWLAYKLALMMAIFFLILAIIDYFYQRWQYYQNLKMSVEEVKEETKQYEGDPQVKARIRSIQRDIARRRMMGQVPEASVVITNPHEIAVALKYDRESMEAPQVVAKGERLIAARIKEVAREAHVPIVEDRPLARALHREIPLGGYITSDYYQAVAEILAYIYRLRRPTPSVRPRLSTATRSVPPEAAAGGR